MINSLRLILITTLICLALAAIAEETAPIFSDNSAPIFENTYLIDNVGNNSEGADLTLRIHKKAPFGLCSDRLNCPASVIVSGATGNVNMPVDVNVRSLYVGKNPVIDSSGRWIGASTGLIGPAGPKGDTGPQGFQGLKGDAGPMGPAGFRGEKGDIGPVGPQGESGAVGLKGDKGDKGEAGEGCWFDNQMQRINCAGGTWIDISQLKGPAGERGPDGAKGDQGVKGDKGDQGEPGQGCWYDDTLQRINCAGGTWISIASLKGAQGEGGPIGIQGPQGLKGDKGEPGPKGTVGACRQVTKILEADPSGLITAFAECASDELVMSGGCSWNIYAGASLKSFGPSLEQSRYYCTADRDTSKRPLWGQIQAEAICCKK